MSEQFSVNLQLVNGYQFLVDFGDAGRWQTDEPQPLGQGEGPNPARLLATAVANCLAASLLFALRKYKDDPSGLRATVQGEMVRQEGRLRIGQLQVQLTLNGELTHFDHLERALAQFEQFCIVTQSVRQGIAVSVSVQNDQGELLHQS